MCQVTCWSVDIQVEFKEGDRKGRKDTVTAKNGGVCSDRHTYKMYRIQKEEETLHEE